MQAPLFPLAVLLALAAPEDAPVAEARAATERFLADWNDGRLKDAYAGFTLRLQQVATLTQLEASLVPVSTALGKYVAVEAARASDDTIDGQRALVLDTTLRFERGTTTGRFALLFERGAWRLRYVKLDLPLDKRPPLDDAPVGRIAGEILAGVERDGLGSLPRLLPEARAQFGEEAVRQLFDRTAATLGPLRSHTLDTPAALGEDCRQVTGRARFEHGDAALRLALCADQGVWRLRAIDVAPVMTPALFERLAHATLAQQLKRSDFELSCPPTLTAVGGEATCRFTSKGKTGAARVRRVEDADVEVALEAQ